MSDFSPTAEPPRSGDAARLAALRERLAEEAARAGLLEVACRIVDAPVGRLLLAATAEGIVRVAFEGDGFDAVLGELSARLGPQILMAPRRLEVAARELDEYFAGRRRRFDLALDRRLACGFRRQVLACLQQIDFGETRSYAAIASCAGSPRAVRAVGTACARNPLPILIPCHRVVRSDGSLGGYAGGTAAKQALLALEHAAR